MKTGLVLEGGAMRGMYTCGVLDVLMENNIMADGVVGVSAGAIFGINYKSHQIGRVLRYNLACCHDPRYGTVRSLLKTGDLYDTDFCYHELPERLDPFDFATYEADPMPFYVVCTDVQTGQPTYHLCPTTTGDDLLWIRASASLPMVSRPVEIAGRQLLDGGMSDSVPLLWFRQQGYTRNLVVLTRPAGYRKSDRQNPLMSVLLRKYPRMVEAMKGRAAMYNRTMDEIERLETEGDTLVLRPSEDLHLHRTEKDEKKLQAMYDLGRSDATARLAEIQAFFKK